MASAAAEALAIVRATTPSASDELEELKRLFGVWTHNGVYLSPETQNTLKDVCVRESLAAAVEHARWNLWPRLR